MGHQSQESGVPHMVAIVGATGGPDALAIILSGLPDTFSVPIVVVISMPDENVDWFVRYASQTSRLPIVVVGDGQVPQPGTVHVAGTDRRLLLEQGRLRFAELEPKVCDTMPTLFRTMARELGPGAVAVILSGMGENCGEAMKAVRDADGHTIAQDKQTSLVYGMARRAVEFGGVGESLPVQEIAPRLAALTTQGENRRNV